MVEIMAAGGGDGLELVVGEPIAEVAARRRKGVVEDIIGIVHPIDAEDGAEAAFVERAVVRDQREPFYQGLDLCPYIRKHRCVFRICRSEPMDPSTKPLVILRLRVDEAVERVLDHPVPHDDHPHAAHAGRVLVGRLEIYGCEIKHLAGKDTK